MEEYEALRENIPKMEVKLFMTKGAIQLQLADHRVTGLQRQRKFVESRVGIKIFNIFQIFTFQVIILKTF